MNEEVDFHEYINEHGDDHEVKERVLTPYDLYAVPEFGPI
jgi:hypothetical protein